MRVKKKLQINAILTIGFALVIGLSVYWAMNKVNKQNKTDRLANNMVKAIAELNIVTYEYLLHHEEWLVTQWRLKYDSLKEFLKNIQFDGRKKMTLQNTLRQRLKNINTLFAQLTSNYDKRESLREEKLILFDELQERLTSRLIVQSQDMASKVSQLHKITQAATDKIHRDITLLVIMSAVILGLLISAISYFTNRGLASSIDKLHKGSQVIGSGNLDFKVCLESNDEIGQLSIAFDQMVENLKRVMASRDDLEKEIKERKQAEESLRESEEFSSGLLEGSPNPMLVYNQDTSVKYANPMFEELSGFTSAEVLGKKAPYPWWIDDPEFGTVDQRIKSIREGVRRIERLFRKKDGKQFWVEINNIPIFRDGKHNYTFSIWSDISERKQAEEQIKASLKEKEMLLSEIHHRVKNNMQVVTSLLRLQAANIKDKKYMEMLEESQSRIRSMALVHEQLYQSKNFTNVNFKRYIKSLVNNLFRSYGIDTNKIKAKIEAEDVSIPIDSAVPCGLLINELVSNSLKHAFPENGEGEITILLHSINEDELELIVSDNGIGMPEGLDIKNIESFGMQLISILAEDQLNGKMELDGTGGTKYQIRFKRKMYRPRITRDLN